MHIQDKGRSSLVCVTWLTLSHEDRRHSACLQSMTILQKAMLIHSSSAVRSGALEQQDFEAAGTWQLRLCEVWMACRYK